MLLVLELFVDHHYTCKYTVIELAVFLLTGSVQILVYLACMHP